MRTRTRLVIVIALLVAATTLIIGVWGLYALQRSRELAVFEALTQTPHVDQPTLITLVPALVAIGLLAASAAFYLDRQIARPIRRLSEQAMQTPTSYEHLPDLPQRRDEIGDLALGINTMATQLNSCLTRLEERTTELDETTRLLAESSSRNQRYRSRLGAYAQAARAIASTLNPDELLEDVVHRISQHFRCYHVAVYLVDESGLWAELRATNGEHHQGTLVHGHRLGVGTQSNVGTVTRTGKPRIVHDAAMDPFYTEHLDLPHTQSEITLPLVTRGRILGALDVQSTEKSVFDDDDVLVLGILADQVAYSLDNAMLFQKCQAAIAQLQTLQHQYTSDAWDQYLDRNELGFYEYGRETLTASADEALTIPESVLLEGVTAATVGENGHAAELVAPIRVRGTVIGALGVQDEAADARHIWSNDDIALLESVADQVAQALETARLYHQAKQWARREHMVAQIAGRIRSAPDMDGILRTAVQDIRRTLGVSHAAIRLGTEAHLIPPRDENGPRPLTEDGEGYDE